MRRTIGSVNVDDQNRISLGMLSMIKPEQELFVSILVYDDGGVDIVLEKDDKIGVKPSLVDKKKRLVIPKRVIRYAGGIMCCEIIYDDEIDAIIIKPIKYTIDKPITL